MLSHLDFAFRHVGVVVFFIVLIWQSLTLNQVLQEQCDSYNQEVSNPISCSVFKSAGTTSFAIIAAISGFIKVYLTLVCWAFYRSL